MSVLNTSHVGSQTRAISRVDPQFDADTSRVDPQLDADMSRVDPQFDADMRRVDPQFDAYMDVSTRSSTQT